MTDAPGTYALLLQNEERQEIEVGALGEMIVRPGVYLYVGSAFGPGGLRARVWRHARGDGALHWHVDYLRAATALEAVWYTHDPERRECTWAAVLRSLPGASDPVDGFGASDCTCPAHLVHVAEWPSWDRFRDHLHARVDTHSAVCRAPGAPLS
ncbi:GIY-YIG nuclease family protein [Salinibacter ruber]|uniref:GIY-YIG nuclease family protein n=1 Tax=Salinibacter ruber TaxID=146919 RepID=UPI00216782D4|nr:GIY-YIG nuclease family protein [Salinibacter ruber]MCS4198804.1 Uri superfamily endonuclease [Salinibacter ruber]